MLFKIYSSERSFPLWIIITQVTFSIKSFFHFLLNGGCKSCNLSKGVSLTKLFRYNTHRCVILCSGNKIFSYKYRNS